MIGTATQAAVFGGLVIGGVGHPVHLLVGIVTGASMRNGRAVLLCAVLAGVICRLIALILGRPPGALPDLADAATVVATALAAAMAWGCRHALSRG
jgi:hypothetical protein